MTIPHALNSRAFCRAPADPGAGGGASPAFTAEIVTFRLQSGTDEVDFLRAAQATEAPLAAQPGFLRRSLCRDDTGQWTDYVEWRDLASARAAAELMIALPEFGTFVAAMDPDTLSMRHATGLRSIGD